MLRQFTYYLFILLFYACSSKQRGSNETKLMQQAEKKSFFSIKSPTNGTTLKSNEEILLQYESSDSNIKVDSCILYADGVRLFDVENGERVSVKDFKMGVSRFSLNIYSEGIKEIKPFSLKIVPSRAPIVYGYVVVKENPHDIHAYTQGLFYHDGLLYEGTGQLGFSEIRKVAIETGKPIRSKKLEDRYFGEGICLLNDKVYQLTWQNKKGFIYNQNFELLSEFSYNTEGWGITTDGKFLWMSDGSHLLYKMDPETMSVIDQVEVFTDKGQVMYLNELEYIKGEIWANVYTSDFIVRIRPETGEVLGIIELKEILDKKYYTANTDVLNGIAYDSLSNRIWVTGKKWPKLFEIKIVPKFGN